MAVSRILSWMIIYLIRLSERPLEKYATVTDRPYRIGRDATIPEDRRTGYPPSVLSCTAWGFSCRANYSARGELLPRLFTLACAEKNSCSLKEPAVSFL
jgi:hypothetical protein